MVRYVDTRDDEPNIELHINPVNQSYSRTAQYVDTQDDEETIKDFTNFDNQACSRTVRFIDVCEGTHGQLETGYRRAEGGIQDVARRLRRSLATASIQGAGEVSLPSAAQPAAKAARLGLLWPREGSHRCERCTACIKGTCRKWKRDVICKGC